MASSPRFRLSARYGRFYAGRTHSLQFRVERWNAVTRTWDPEDLTQYTAVRFQAFSGDSDVALLKNVALTVLTSSTYLVSGTACRCSGSVKFTATATSIRCQLVLVAGSESEVVEAQWEADVYAGGPTS